jgi:hypothetical protein
MKMVRSILVGHGVAFEWLSRVGVVCLIDRNPLAVFLPCPFGVSLDSE